MSYSVSEVSRLLGISTQILRLWEKEDSFPKVERTMLGARRYTDDNLAEIRAFIEKKHPTNNK